MNHRHMLAIHRRQSPLTARGRRSNRIKAPTLPRDSKTTTSLGRRWDTTTINNLHNKGPFLPVKVRIRLRGTTAPRAQGHTISRGPDISPDLVTSLSSDKNSPALWRAS